MAKQMGGITLKDEEETLYTNENRSNNKLSTKCGYESGDKGRSHQGTAQLGELKKTITRVSSEEI